MAEQRPSLAGSGRCRQGRAPPRNSRQDNVRNRLLSAQRAFDARTLQRSRSLALGRRKSAALAARCRHERGSGSQSFGKRPPQSRRSPPHGLERHAKGWGKRLAPGQVQASRLGRTLPCPTPNPVLKCDRPGGSFRPPCNLLREPPSWRARSAETLMADSFPPPLHRSLAQRLRAWFFTGLIVFGHVAVTAYIAWWAIDTVDNWVRPWFPLSLSPDGYLPFHVPGFGVVIAIVGLTLLGFLTANFIGQRPMKLAVR